jgi:hypothetical protein
VLSLLHSLLAARERTLTRLVTRLVTRFESKRVHHSPFETSITAVTADRTVSVLHGIQEVERSILFVTTSFGKTETTAELMPVAFLMPAWDD